MLFRKLAVASATAMSTCLTLAQNATQNLNAGGGAGGADGATLDPANIQKASDLTGQETGTDGIKPGQAASQT